ncbi:uncharacterized protein F4822DRAFT_193057 [Hypoxylon trugodes]|uniref:uncharacterized protein n=1 Tax=Hypoxylon trugodes TaxID=326681 RepID=UPI0021A24A8A|nr:uncharacterized protein F4822DRAFT_193057 [Hypoxylon trugodes]KAI1391697.1 hypothetical protein F4822DRAFT_193057 [Hypoxylon trugodes]
MATTPVGWNSLPLEIQTMIISSLERQDFRRAWFDCRLVNRSFRDATEGAFKSQVIPGLVIGVMINGARAIYGFGRELVHENPYRESHFNRENAMGCHIEFNGYSEDDCYAMFRETIDTEVESSSHKTELGEPIPSREIEYEIGSQLFPYCPLLRLVWGDAVKNYRLRKTGERCRLPYVICSYVLYKLPSLEHFDIDSNGTKGMAIEWRPLTSYLMRKNIKIGECLKIKASQDHERTAEQDVRIAMSSETERKDRFESMFSALHKDCDVTFFCYTSKPDDHFKGSWYREWVWYLTT